MPTSRAHSIPRIGRDRRDDRYQAGRAAPWKRAEAGYVVSIQDDLDTVTVRVLDENLTGVVPLGDMPPLGAIVEVESRGDLLVIPLWYPGPPPPTSYCQAMSIYGPHHPVAWNGGPLTMGESVTNNARYYSVKTEVTGPPEFQPGFGFTETPTTSSAPYNYSSAFVSPNRIPLLNYRDADANHYGLGLYQLDDINVSVVSWMPYPSQSFSNVGFIRAMVPWNDSEIWCYGNSFSGGYTVKKWETSCVGGTFTPFVDGGLVAHSGGSYPGGGTDYLGNVSNPIIFHQSLAIQTNTRGIYDRNLANTIHDGYGIIPATGTDKTLDQGFFANPAAPGHLYCIRRSSFNVFSQVVDMAFTKISGSAPTAAVAHTWSIPAGATFAIAGPTARGNVVCYTRDDAFNVRAFYDIFGAAAEFTPDNDPVINGYGFVSPTLPNDLPSNADAWLTLGGSGTSSGDHLCLITHGYNP